MFIKINSHRARDRVASALGRLPQGYFDWNKKGEWREISPEEFEKVKDIKGVTKSRVKSENLCQYISW